MSRLGLVLIAIAGCARTPLSAEPGQPTERVDPAQARTQSEIDEDVAAGRQWEVDSVSLPLLPDWWFDEPVEEDGSLLVCLQAIGEDQAAATEAVSEQLLRTIAERYGDDASVEVDVTQNLAPLAMGRVRLAARFRITPVEDSDG